LSVSERLDRRMGGPSIQQFAMRPGIHVTPIVEYGKFDWNSPHGHRRSIYRFIFRTLPDPFVECFDGADASQWTPVRSTSVTALQALSLFNGELVLAQSNALAELLKRRSVDHDSLVSNLCWRMWGRAPTKEETAAMWKHAQEHGVASLIRVLFNSNEFLFLD
jgi:hypothetical protein